MVDIQEITTNYQVELSIIVGGLIIYKVLHLRQLRLLRSLAPFIFVVFFVSRHYNPSFSFTLNDLHGLWTKYFNGKQKLFNDILLFSFIFTLYRAITFIQKFSFSDFMKSFMTDAYEMSKSIPFVKQKIEQRFKEIEGEIEQSLKGHSTKDKILVLPKEGRDAASIIAEMEKYCEIEDAKWKKGYLSGGVYSGEADHMKLLTTAASLYAAANPLHSHVWPSIMKFEAEIISMTASLLNGGDQNVVGCMSSGGTESIILAAKTHRDYYRAKGIRNPQIIACVTAHAAIDKACDLMGIKLIKTPLDPKTFKADVHAMERAITSDTIMLYSSAPNFPQGVIDNIPALSKLAKKYGIGLHVDCCLGGFVLPFARKLGYNIPDFDFKLPGVTSMSVDTHKFGYALKGTSVVLYRSRELRKYQFFTFPEWTGGLYVTPAVAGSRPGSLSAACWASLVSLGEEGYLKRTKLILETVQEIVTEMKKIKEIEIFGDTQAMIICFGSKQLSIYKIGDTMASKGWDLNALQKPACLHLCVTVCHVGKSQLFLDDLKSSINEVILMKNGKDIDNGNAAIYGMTSTLPAGPVSDVLRTYTDVVLKP